MIDGHAHACGMYLEAEKIVKVLDEVGLSHVILVPGEPESTKEYKLPNFSKMFPSKNVVKFTNVMSRMVISITGAVKTIPNGNKDVYSLTRETNGRVIQFFWATIDDNDLEGKYREWQFKGIKLHQCWEKFSIDSDFFVKVAKFAEKKKLPLFIHLYSDKDVLDLIEYKRNHPNLKLIVAHLFGAELFIKNDYRDDNLYFDISPYQLNSDDRIIKAINFFGSSQLVFGSDTPYGKDSLYKGIERVKALIITDEDKERILSSNMKELLEL